LINKKNVDPSRLATVSRVQTCFARIRAFIALRGPSSARNHYRAICGRV
jgi:hypothetical protein